MRFVERCSLPLFLILAFAKAHFWDSRISRVSFWSWLERIYALWYCLICLLVFEIGFTESRSLMILESLGLPFGVGLRGSIPFGDSLVIETWFE
ncbi:hypothetical protein BBW65_03150 [Helicobacter enhydrae]|uniref:Uncharacterized protein n=1 Tax=Helicobacter enhydrae TaxID=222136 RepID=A0A1B1U528_9HELI|nr:hypothetical protein BBW65_03150 [Helicobacter enhydrae]